MKKADIDEMKKADMKKFLIVASIVAAVILFGIWYRGGPELPNGPVHQNNSIEDVNK